MNFTYISCFACTVCACVYNTFDYSMDKFPLHFEVDPFHVHLEPFHVYLDTFHVYKVASVLIG